MYCNINFTRRNYIIININKIFLLHICLQEYYLRNYYFKIMTLLIVTYI